MSSHFNAVPVHSKHLIATSSGSNNPADFTVNFGNSDYHSGNVLKVTPLDMSIPNMFPNVTEANNFAFIAMDGANLELTMPTGYYSVDEYMAEFQAQMAAVPAITTTLDSWEVGADGVLVINWTGLAAWSPETAGNNTQQLWGSDGETIQSTATASLGQWVFENPVNFLGVTDLIVETNFTSSNAIHGNDNTQLKLYDYVSLAETCHGTVKHQQLQTENVRDIPLAASTSLSTVRFKLVDCQLKPLTLPNNYTVCVHMLVTYGDDY